MKDSGVEWIGEIPEDWKIGRVKDEFSVVLGKMLQTSPKSLNDTLENYACASNVKWSGYNADVSRKMWFSSTERREYLLVNGDVLVMEGGTAGTSCIYQGENAPCYMQNSINRCRNMGGYPNKLLYYYLFHVFYCGYIESICNKSTIRHYTKEKIENTPLVIPENHEQLRIADYLDAKCAEIDKVVEKTRETIEEYRKLKQSIITETVTKGLNPDAEMKDSGIPWIGQIPVEWKFTRIGSLYGLRVEKVSDLDFQSLSVTKLGIVPQLETTAKTNAHDDRKLVKVGDFVINSRSDRRGSCGISKYEGSVSLINTILYPIAEMNPRYYNWLFHTKEFADEFYRWGHGIVDDLWTTGWQDMKNIVIVQPSLSEQRRIADYLDAKCTELDSIIEKKEQLIEELGSYKKSLIYEYVIGKKEVQA